MISRIVVTALLLQSVLPQPMQQTGKGSIEGVVLRIGTNEPIENARVALTKSPISLNSTRMGSSSSVMTDAAGRFAFKDLDAEYYRLTFSDNGYVRQEYGQRVFFGGGSPIDLTAGQEMKDIVVRMTPAGSVSGRIQDANRKPLVSVPIQLMRYVYDYSGKRMLQNFGNAQTNDRGEYRVFFVTPGRYYLNAGSVGVESPSPGRTEIRDSYSSVFYPGVPDVAQASAIDVQPGANVPGIDLTLARQQLFRVRGRIVDASTGQPPARVEIRLIRRDESTGQDSNVEDHGGQRAIYDKGAFEFRDVAPGMFAVSASADDPVRPAAPATASAGERPRTVNELQHTGHVSFAVTNGDIDGILLTVAGGSSISGKLSIDGAPPSAGSNQSMAIYLTPAVNGVTASVESLPESGTNEFNGDGTFRINNVLPGEYRIDIESWLPPGFYMKEARFGGIDVLNRPLQFNGSESGTLDIRISPNTGVIDGRVRDEQLKSMPAALVVLVPDRNRIRTRLFRPMSTDQNGHFRIADVEPGDYLIFAWEALEPYGYFDPELLRQSEPKGIPIHVGELSNQSVNLKVIPLP